MVARVDRQQRITERAPQVLVVRVQRGAIGRRVATHANVEDAPYQRVTIRLQPVRRQRQQHVAIAHARWIDQIRALDERIGPEHERGNGTARESLFDRKRDLPCQSAGNGRELFRGNDDDRSEAGAVDRHEQAVEKRQSSHAQVRRSKVTNDNGRTRLGRCGCHS